MIVSAVHNKIFTGQSYYMAISFQLIYSIYIFKIKNMIQRGTRLCILRFSSFYSRKKAVQRVCRNSRIVSLVGVERSWGPEVSAEPSSQETCGKKCELRNGMVSQYDNSVDKRTQKRFSAVFPTGK